MVITTASEPSNQDMEVRLNSPVILHTCPPSSLEGVRFPLGYDLHHPTNKIDRQLLGSFYTKDSKSRCQEIGGFVQLFVLPKGGCVRLTVEFEVVDVLEAGITVGSKTCREIYKKWPEDMTIGSIELGLNRGNRILTML